MTRRLTNGCPAETTVDTDHWVIVETLPRTPEDRDAVDGSALAGSRIGWVSARLVALLPNDHRDGRAREPFLALFDTIAAASTDLTMTLRFAISRATPAHPAVADLVVRAVGDDDIETELAAVARLLVDLFNDPDGCWQVELLPFHDLGWPTDGHAVAIRQPTVPLHVGEQTYAIPTRFADPGASARTRLWEVLDAGDGGTEVFLSLKPGALGVDDLAALDWFSTLAGVAEPFVASEVGERGRLAAHLGAYRGVVAHLELVAVGARPLGEIEAAAIAQCFTAPPGTLVGPGVRVAAGAAPMCGGFVLDPLRDPGVLFTGLSQGVVRTSDRPRAINDLATATEWSFLLGWPLTEAGTLPGLPVGGPAPPPVPEPSAVTLGTDPLGRPVQLADPDRRLHLLALGGTGSGKTSLLSHLARQDLAAGRMTVIIDAHGDLLDRARAGLPRGRRGDVVFLDCEDATGDTVDVLGVMGRSAAEAAQTAKAIVAGVAGELSTEYAGPVFRRYGAAFLAALATWQLPITDLTRCFDDGRWFSKHMDDRFDGDASRVAVEYWGRGDQSRSEIWSYVESKFETLLTGPAATTLSSSGSDIDPEGLFADDRVLLVHPGSDPEQAQIVSSVILSLLLTWARHRRPTDATAAVYLDEVQHCTGQVLRRAVHEARKRGLALHLATQNLTNLSSEASVVLGNVGTVLAGRVTESTAASIWQSFDLPAERLRVLPNLQMLARLMRDGIPLSDIAVAVPPPDPVSARSS